MRVRNFLTVRAGLTSIALAGVILEEMRGAALLRLKGGRLDAFGGSGEAPPGNEPLVHPPGGTDREKRLIAYWLFTASGLRFGLRWSLPELATCEGEPPCPSGFVYCSSPRAAEDVRCWLCFLIVCELGGFVKRQLARIFSRYRPIRSRLGEWFVIGGCAAFIFAALSRLSRLASGQPTSG